MTAFLRSKIRFRHIAVTPARGTSPLGSSRLYEFAKILDVPVSYFFDEMPSNALSGRGRKEFGEAGTPFEQEKDPLIKRETLELVRAYYKIRESRVRKRIFEMVRAVGAATHALFRSRMPIRPPKGMFRSCRLANMSRALSLSAPGNCGLPCANLDARR